MKKLVFRGVATALITPFKESGVDYDALGRLIDFQIEGGVDALVAAGTTGEGATLSAKEHEEVLQFFVDKVAGRVPVIAGTGSNDTAFAIELTRFADKIGCDAMLLVTPYYNKATQNGLVESFTAIAGATSRPCILYNVPSRTGCNLLPASVAKLAKVENIVGIKEASGNLSQIADVAALCPEDFAIYSGNDDQIVPILSLGGQGVISVLSNPLPRETGEICRRWFAGDTKGALDLQLKYLPLIHALFSEVNPIPVKCAMNALGFGENRLRLPLTRLEEEHKKTLLALLKKEIPTLSE